MFTLLKPAVGTHTLVANFAAQGTFAPSSATGSLLVNQAPIAGVTETLGLRRGVEIRRAASLSSENRLADWPRARVKRAS